MVISSLAGGGAERVLVLLAKGLTAMGHRVSVVTIFGTDHDFYALPEGVDRIALGLGKTTATPAQKIAANRKRISALRDALRTARPDAVRPVVCVCEVAARPADDRNPKLSHRLDHVQAGPPSVGQDRSRLEHPAVDLPAKALEELPEDHPIAAPSATMDFHASRFCGGCMRISR